MATHRKKKRRGLPASAKAAIALISLALVVGLVLGGSRIIKDFSTRRTFPLKYDHIILEQARERDLDPSLVAGVIWAESGYRPAVTSSAGAVGLMQITPDTAAWIAGKLALDPESLDLTDPQTNITLGCWYLRFLADKFSGQLPELLAAYNAGHNKVAQWLQDPAYSADGQHLTEIPYKETDAYVDKVQRAQQVYRDFYHLGQS